MEPAELYYERLDHEQRSISTYLHCDYTDKVREHVIEQLKTELKKTRYYAKIEKSFPFEIDLLFTKRKKITVTIFADRYKTWTIQGFYNIEKDITLRFEEDGLQFCSEVEILRDPEKQARHLVPQIIYYISSIYDMGIKN